MRPLRQQLGALVFDVPRLLAALAGDWKRMRNRRERVTRDPRTGGVQCHWVFSSDLHVAEVWPRTGGWLMRKAFAEWPIRYAEVPLAAGEPRVTFIIGHRGEARLPLLQKTLASIAGQSIPIECIVVEQSDRPVVQPPPWVRYLHTPVPAGAPYNRAATFNAGARLARAKLLVLHDNDMPVPERYAEELTARHGEGWELIDLKRFIFYVDGNGRIEHVTQNLLGGSIAADAEAYRAIGGFDESFRGWGGEDNEFWDRARTRRVWNFGYLPILHLWHAPQPEKARVQQSGTPRYDELRHIDPHERIARLRGSERSVEPGLVSTIIPVFNRPAMLREAVASVLAQTYRNIEVIVVDDGSTDNTPRVIAELGVRSVRIENRGPGAAREAGRQLARGEFLQYLDSDDLLTARKFELQVAALRDDPEAGIAYGNVRHVDLDGNEIPIDWKPANQRQPAIFPSFLVARWWDTPAPLYRRSVTDAIGPWTSLRAEEDWEYDARAGALGVRLAYVDEVVAVIRDHPEGRLSGSADAATLRNRATAHELIAAHALRAGIDPQSEEFQRYARELFLLARQCGAAGLSDESRRLTELARSLSGARDVRVYAMLARLCGWRAAGRAAAWMDRLR
jgi:GT2 family glycosyltransferase